MNKLLNDNHISDEFGIHKSKVGVFGGIGWINRYICIVIRCVAMVSIFISIDAPPSSLMDSSVSPNWRQ
jgi:hypothetical protein